LTILAAEIGDERWPKLAARWHARFVSKTPGIGPPESALVLAAAGALGGQTFRAGRQTLRQLAKGARPAVRRSLTYS
jgi:hypothetical protein